MPKNTVVDPQSRSAVSNFANSPEFKCTLAELSKESIGTLTQTQRKELQHALSALEVAHQNLQALKSATPENVEANCAIVTKIQESSTLVRKIARTVSARCRKEASPAKSISHEIIRRERAIYRRTLVERHRLGLAVKKIPGLHRITPPAIPPTPEVREPVIPPAAIIPAIAPLVPQFQAKSSSAAPAVAADLVIPIQLAASNKTSPPSAPTAIGLGSSNPIAPIAPEAAPTLGQSAKPAGLNTLPAIAESVAAIPVAAEKVVESTRPIIQTPHHSEIPSDRPHIQQEFELSDRAEPPPQKSSGSGRFWTAVTAAALICTAFLGWFSKRGSRSENSGMNPNFGGGALCCSVIPRATPSNLNALTVDVSTNDNNTISNTTNLPVAPLDLGNSNMTSVTVAEPQITQAVSKPSDAVAPTGDTSVRSKTKIQENGANDGIDVEQLASVATKNLPELTASETHANTSKSASVIPKPAEAPQTTIPLADLHTPVSNSTPAAPIQTSSASEIKDGRNPSIVTNSHEIAETSTPPAPSRSASALPPPSIAAPLDNLNTTNAETFDESQIGVKPVGSLGSAPTGSQIIRNQISSQRLPNNLNSAVSSSGDAFVTASLPLFDRTVHLGLLKPEESQSGQIYIGAGLLSGGSDTKGFNINAGVLAEMGEGGRVHPILDARGKTTHEFEDFSITAGLGLSYLPSEIKDGRIDDSDLFYAFEGSIATHPRVVPAKSLSHQFSLNYSVAGSVQNPNGLNFLNLLYQGEIALLAKPLIPKDLYLSWYAGPSMNPEFHPDQKNMPGIEFGIGTEARYKNTFFYGGIDNFLGFDGEYNVKASVRAEWLINSKHNSRLGIEAQTSLTPAESRNSLEMLPRENGIRAFFSTSF